MPEYTDDLILSLLGCPKRVIRAPRRAMHSARGSKHNDMRLRSDVNGEEFEVFVRVNLRFEENFSIGIRHCSPDGGGEILLRCNGPHGLHKPDHDDSVHNIAPHIHYAKEANISAGLKAEHGAEKTDEYGVDYAQALSVFLGKINAGAAAALFAELPRTAAGPLPFGPDEEVVP
jgi:hypothetical protein